MTSSVVASQQQIANAGKLTTAAMGSQVQAMHQAGQMAGQFSTQVKRMQAPVDQLANSVRKNDVSWRQLGQVIKNNGDIARQQMAIQKGQIGVVRDLGGGLMEAEFQTTKLSDTTVGLSQRVGVMAAAFRGASTNLVNWGKNMQWAGRQIMVGLAVPLGFFAYRAVKAAEEYDRAMTRVIKVTDFTAKEGTEAFRAQELAVRAQIRALADLGTQMGFTSVETAEAAGEFSQMGFQGKQLDILTNAAQQLAFTSGTEMPEAIELSRIVIQGFDKELNELIPTFARLNMIENNTSLSIADMTQSIPVVAAVAHNLGIEIEEVTGLIAMMSDAGISAKEGATALRTGLIQIVQEATPQAIEAFRNVGLSLEEMRERHRGDTLGFLDELGQHLRGLTDQGDIDDFTAALSKLTGVRQAGRFLTFLQEIPDRLVEGSDAFRAWSGAAADGAEAMAKFNFERQQIERSAAGTADRLRAEIATLMEQAGQPLLEFANTLRGVAVAVLEWYTNLSEGSRRILKVIVTATAIAGPLLMVAGILANLAGQFGRLVSGLIVFGTRTKFVTSEQAALEAMMRRGFITAEHYANAMARVSVAQNAAAGSAAAAAAGMAGQPQLPGMGGVGAPAGPERTGALGRAGTGLAVAGGLATIGSLVKDITTGTADWGTALTKVFITTTLFGPVFRTIKANMAAVALQGRAAAGSMAAFRIALSMAMGPIGWISLAVAGIAAGIFAWKKHAREAFEAIEESSESAEKIAEQMGLAWNDTAGLTDSVGQAKKVMADLRKENSGLIEDLKAMNPDERRARIHEIGMDLVWKGNDPEAVEESLKTWMEQMGLDIPINLDDSNMQNQMAVFETSAKMMVDRIASYARQNSLMKELFGSDTENSRRAAEIAGERIGSALASGTEEGFWQAGMQWKSLTEQLEQEFIGDPEGFQRHLEGVRRGIEESFGVELPPIDTQALYEEARRSGKDFEELYTQALLNIGTDLEQFAQDGRIPLANFANFVEGESGRALASTEKLLEAAREKLKELQAEFANTNNPLRKGLLALQIFKVSGDVRTYERDLNALKVTTKAVADETEGAGDATNDYADAVQKASSALRSSVQEEMNFITGLMLEEFDDRARAEDEMWNTRLDNLKEAQEAEMETLRATQEREREILEERYDTQIKKLEEVAEEEDELERHRQHAFAMEKLRRDYLNRRAQGNLSVDAAIARGDVDEAARIQQDMQNDFFKFNSDVAEAERKFQDETREKQRAATIEAYETARDEAVKAMEVEQEAAQKILEASHEMRTKQVQQARESARERNDIARRAYERELDVLKDFIPRNQAEFDGHMADLTAAVEKHGGDMETVSRKYHNIVGTNIVNAFQNATADATRGLAEDRRWEDAGKAIGEQIIAGLLGEEYVAPSPATWAGRRGTSSASNVGANGLPRALDRQHSGGMIDRSTAYQGLKPGENLSILQTGEYVMDRKTVAKYGPEFFKGLQKFHQGGLVDHLGDLSPLMAMSHTLGQVLSGTPVQETGNLGAAVHKMISGKGLADYAAGAELGQYGYIPGLANLKAPDRDATWRETNWKVGMKPHVINKVAGVLAGIPGGQVITSAFRRGATVAGSGRRSLHSMGKAVDIGIRARRAGGTLASEREGDRIAAAFRATPGIKEVLWKTMTGGNHYDHVHAGFYHKGGLVGGNLSIPALKAGATVNFDNTLANLHKGEKVLTAPLSAQLEEGISRLANGAGNVYDVDVVIQGNASAADADTIANAVIKKIQQRENRQGRHRRVG